MGRYIRKYTDSEIDALLKAVLLDNVGIAEAVRRAPQGRLGVPAFTMNRGYAYDLVKKKRDDFEGRHDEALEKATADELKKAHRANLRALRALGDDADPAERARLAKALADAQRARGAKPSKATMSPRHGQPKTAETGESDDGGVLAGLLKNAKGPHKGGPSNGNGTG